MKRQALTAIVGLCLMLGSCMNYQPGIFGRLPELYEQTAANQRALEELLGSGDNDDTSARSAMAAFMQSVKNLQGAAEKEARVLKGTPVPVSASMASGLRPGPAVIADVNPGVVTTVEIRIPLQQPLPAGTPAYICFLDEDGEAVAKSEAWYDNDIKSLRLDIPFAVNPDGVTVPEGTFIHYDRAMQLKFVSALEYQADNYEGVGHGTLLTLEPTEDAADTESVSDTTAAVEIPDSVADSEADIEPAWTGPVLTAKGIGALTLGTSLKALPDKMPGVYDSKKLEKQYDEMEEEPMLTATFYTEGKVVMTALGDEQGNMVFLTVESPAIKIDINGHYFGIGDSLQSIYGLKDVVPDETGAFAATYRGISIAPTPTGRIHALSIGAVW